MKNHRQETLLFIAAIFAITAFSICFVYNQNCKTTRQSIEMKIRLEEDAISREQVRESKIILRQAEEEIKNRK